MDEKLLSRLGAIVTACREANPDLDNRHSKKASVLEKAAHIRRADVAAALLLDWLGARREASLMDLDLWWNFNRDQLSSQSDECIGFVVDRLKNRRP